MNWWPVDSSEVRLFNVAPDSTGLLRVDPMIYAKASAESYEIISYVPKPPVADFTYSQNSGNAPLFVQFTDTSTNDPENWEWNFGDGKTHSSQNPGHTYSFPGTYTVSLTASNGEGRSTETKENLITVDFTGPLTDIVLSTFNKKTGTLGQGGYLELVSSGDLSYVRVGGSDYTLADGDVVRFENPSDVINGRISLSGGSVYGSDLDMAFNVYKNGVYLGTGYPGGLIFYDEVRSTLVVTVSNRRGYMALAADGFTISDGKTTSGVHLYGLMPDDLGNMDLAMDSRHGVDYTGFVYDYDITY
ncbi:PKD domain-containing protein [Methanoplanus sp. FWC-SCC4]|uniref:PKD domain-containing protein n=2 Tax=Methanochimaera problematica TaxID=2609417 RepID=A0AA97FH36_9EURY|nr:PKD domain-containing protein [Methanoplanus sp. FWC-SCC4]